LVILLDLSISAQRRRRDGDAGAHRRELQPEPPGLVRRRRVRDDVPLPGEHDLRRPGHQPLPGRMAVGSTADPGPRVARPQRRHHLRHRVDLYLHPGAGPPAALPRHGGHHARHRHEQHDGVSGAPSAAPSPAAGHVTYSYGPAAVELCLQERAH